MRKRVVLAFGTRPEAIKMAPVYKELEKCRQIEPLILLTGQHKTQLEQALEIFDVPVARNLEVMTQCQTLPELASRILPQAAAAFRQLKADYVLVHGDTLTTFVSAWAAFLERIPVGHVEAGLRSGSMSEPFPEEANRVLTDALCDTFFAPTEGARANLLKSGAPSGRIFVTGQTAVDAILFAAQKGTLPEGVPARGPVVTVTLHRRENWPILRPLAEQLAEVARCHEGWTFVFPVHLNPLVREAVVPPLSTAENVKLIDPLEYGRMAALLARSTLILTDSGGLQEEGASLGVPVAVVRNVTERPEGVDAGIVTLLGCDPQKAMAAFSALMDDSERIRKMASAANPYGDGQAASRIAKALAQRLCDA
ncbi:MAG: non-hydrolyzing UDP-N-acetylglucosamine 2-epimerase [Pyramidobacter sp.]